MTIAIHETDGSIALQRTSINFRFTDCCGESIGAAEGRRYRFTETIIEVDTGCIRGNRDRDCGFMFGRIRVMHDIKLPGFICPVVITVIISLVTGVRKTLVHDHFFVVVADIFQVQRIRGLNKQHLGRIRIILLRLVIMVSAPGIEDAGIIVTVLYDSLNAEPPVTVIILLEYEIDIVPGIRIIR